MPNVKLNNLNFYYEVEGEGFPLVLLAGLSRDSSNWNLIKPLLVNNFQVITLDNRSVGRTEVPVDPYTIAEMGEDVIRLLDYLHLSKAHLLGHSMGGAIAQTIALKSPHYIERFIISNSFVKIAPRSLFWMHHCAALYDANKNPEETMPVVAPWIFSDNFFTDPQRMEEAIALRKN
jgi:pimeloyl-ACP methyl ester carboxylesterase